MKVLFLNSCVHGGGAGRSLATYLKYKTNQIDAHIVMPEPGVIAKDYAPYATLYYIPEFIERVHKSPYKFAANIHSGLFHIILNSWAMFVAMIKIPCLVKKIRPELIYCNHMLAKPFGVFAGWLFQIPVILHVRNIHYTKFGNWFYRFLARRKIVKRLVCNSYASSKSFQSEVPKKIIILYNSVDDEKFSETLNIKPAQKVSPKAIVFGYIGRLVPWKGVNILLDAFSRLQRDYPHISLLIVGENDKGLHIDLQKQYEEFCKEKRIEGCVKFMGFQADIRPSLAQMDVLVLPSITPEPFGRVLIEAMAFQKPSIITEHGGSIEIIEPYKNGLWCTPNDVRSLITAMKYFCSFPEQIKIMGENGYSRLKEQFLSSVQSKKMDTIILNYDDQEKIESLPSPKITIKPKDSEGNPQHIQ